MAGHPIELLRGSTCAQEDPNAPGWEAEICYYNLSNIAEDHMYIHTIPKGQTWKDLRPYAWFNLEDMCAQWLQEQIDMMSIMRNHATNAIDEPDTIGWTSRFRSPSGQIYFMPTLDLDNSTMPPYATDEWFVDHFGWLNIPEPRYIRTDHSWHVYYPIRLPIDRMDHFLGSALLMNHHRNKSLVDTAWVGSSLVRQRMVLRWSCKGSKARPKSVLPRIDDPWVRTSADAIALSPVDGFI